MKLTQKQVYWILLILVIILLFIFLWYYFRNRKKGELCPDGRAIPFSGNCNDNPVLKDANGNDIVTPVTADANGCTQPSNYITNAFPLTLGMKGDLVKGLQEALNRDYNAGLVADGYFGCKTLAAVLKAFLVSTVDAELYKEKVQLLIL